MQKKWLVTGVVVLLVAGVSLVMVGMTGEESTTQLVELDDRIRVTNAFATSCWEGYNDNVDDWDHAEIGTYGEDQIQALMDEGETCLALNTEYVIAHDAFLRHVEELDAQGVDLAVHDIAVEEVQTVNQGVHAAHQESQANIAQNNNILAEQLAFLRGAPSCYDDSSCTWFS